jgi:RNA polymerase sigma factor (sigma-70 family)
VIDEQLIIACRKMHRDAQRKMYETLAPKLYQVCKRYLKKEEDIEEALADAFFIIFTKIDQLKESNAFYSWTKRITINECLHVLKKNVNFNLYLEDTSFKIKPEVAHDTQLEEQDMLKLLNYIPEGCRTVFNLFVIEGYSHKEIASMLKISEGTSKSQLNVAKTKLKDLINNFYYQNAK